MARNISKERLEQKIEKAEKAISRNREQYDRLTAELEELHKRQKAKVSSDFHIRFDNAYYSVDKAYLHKKV